MRTNLALTAAAVVGVCAAIAAPAGFASAETAQETISRLQSQGYTVTIDKVGTASMDKCTVTSVRNPQTQTRTIRVDRGRDRNGNRRYDYVEVVTSRSISVSLDCSR